VLSTAFYVLVALVVDAFVLWSQCGGEWLRAAVGIDLRHIITGSNAVLCKVRATFYRQYCAKRMQRYLVVGGEGGRKTKKFNKLLPNFSI